MPIYLKFLISFLLIFLLIEKGQTQDADMDGWTVSQGDCDDSNPFVNPGLNEVPNNFIDENCDGDTIISCRTCIGTGAIVEPYNYIFPKGVMIEWEAEILEFDYADRVIDAVTKIEFNSIGFLGDKGSQSVAGFINNKKHVFEPDQCPGPSQEPGVNLYFSSVARPGWPETFDNHGLHLFANPTTYPKFTRIFQDIDQTGYVGKNIYTRSNVGKATPDNPIRMKWRIMKLREETNPVGNFSKSFNCDWVQLTGTHAVWRIHVWINEVEYKVADYYLPVSLAKYIHRNAPFAFRQEHFGALEKEFDNEKTYVKYHNFKVTNEEGESIFIDEWQVKGTINETAEDNFGYYADEKYLVSVSGHEIDSEIAYRTNGKVLQLNSSFSVCKNPVDNDMDGYNCFKDCDDANPDINPGIVTNEIDVDLNCDGIISPPANKQLKCFNKILAHNFNVSGIEELEWSLDIEEFSVSPFRTSQLPQLFNQTVLFNGQAGLIPIEINLRNEAAIPREDCMPNAFFNGLFLEFGLFKAQNKTGIKIVPSATENFNLKKYFDPHRSIVQLLVAKEFTPTSFTFKIVKDRSVQNPTEELLKDNLCNNVNLVGEFNIWKVYLTINQDKEYELLELYLPSELSEEIFNFDPLSFYINNGGLAHYEFGQQTTKTRFHNIRYKTTNKEDNILDWRIFAKENDELDNRFGFRVEGNGIATVSGHPEDGENAKRALNTILSIEGCSNIDVEFEFAPIQCFGGIGTVKINSLQDNLSYQWSSGQTNDFISLGAGTYSITVMDNRGCESIRSIDITQPNEIDIKLTESIDSVTSLTTQVIGGTLPYEYKWSDGQTTATASNLTTGVYTLTVTDANGCEKQVTTAISVDLDQDGFNSDVDCDDNNAGINSATTEIPNNDIDEDCDGADLVTTSVHEIGGQKINIFPNPVQHQLNIQLESASNLNYELLDLTGRVIISNQSFSSSTQINLSALNQGTYLLKISTLSGNETIIEKVIKIN